MLTKLDPGSHWLAGQIAGIHLFTLAGGMAIGAAAVLLFHAIGRIASVSGIFFSRIMEGGLWRWWFLGGIVGGAGLGAHLLPSLNIVTRPSPGLLILILSGLLVGWGTRQGAGCGAPVRHGVDAVGHDQSRRGAQLSRRVRGVEP